MRRFPLFVDLYAIPYLLNKPGEGERIRGELFSVDDATLAALDELEGVRALSLPTYIHVAGTHARIIQMACAWTLQGATL